MLYRGFLQNYLFGLPYPKQICCLIGAGMFSASHLLFYLQVNGFHPIFLVQLGITFVSHLVFCYIGEKRNNLLIPIAIHFSQDFLQMI